jgi:hypothetical protein
MNELWMYVVFLPLSRGFGMVFTIAPRGWFTPKNFPCYTSVDQKSSETMKIDGLSFSFLEIHLNRMHLLEYDICLLFHALFYVNGLISKYCIILYVFCILNGPEKKMFL